MHVYPIANGIYVGIGSPHIAHYVTAWFDVPPYFSLQCCSSSVCHLYEEALVRVFFNTPKHPMAGAQLNSMVLSVERQQLINFYNYWCATAVYIFNLCCVPEIECETLLPAEFFLVHCCVAVRCKGSLMGTHIQWQVLALAVDKQHQLFKAEVTPSKGVVPMVDSTPDTQN